MDLETTIPAPEDTNRRNRLGIFFILGVVGLKDFSHAPSPRKRSKLKLTHFLEPQKSGNRNKESNCQPLRIITLSRRILEK